ncbi:hypothetical protein CMI46_01435 [Candidatus Pacearchaeota archaeon]|nr:hypothetical protein [Candidatus Pacearchaeota archaeon]|tara:strand:- start:27982 stop:28224 length:243 start_codon:yes stop_codon:yes gene_type:complete
MSLLIAFVILLASFPVGYVLKYFTKDEMKVGRRYFRVVWILCLCLAIGFLFFPFNDFVYRQSVVFSLLFMANVAFISWKK